MDISIRDFVIIMIAVILGSVLGDLVATAIGIS